MGNKYCSNCRFFELPGSYPYSANHNIPDLRSLSDVQESAQLLTGAEMPDSVPRSVLGNLGKTKLSGAVVVNATPYDGWLEKVCLNWMDKNGMMLGFA